MVDHRFFSYDLWREAAATGADLLWRVRTDRCGPKPEFVEQLDDGSWIAHLRRTKPPEAHGVDPMVVRVIGYEIDAPGQSQAQRLFTTMLDPSETPALELAWAYRQCWEFEIAFGELKTRQRVPRQVLRSKSRDLVLQEIWAHPCCHLAIRTLMNDAALSYGHDPDLVSFPSRRH